MDSPDAKSRKAVRIGIVGGGIGGLAAAVAIARRTVAAERNSRSARAIEIVVYEKVANNDLRARGRGAALLLWSNAVQALSEIGLSAPIRDASAELHETHVRSLKGGVLSRLPIGKWSTPKHPTVVIRRPALLDILRDAVPSDTVEIRTGKGVTSFSILRAARGVALHFDDGTRETVDAVIGADGFHSNIRRCLLGEESTREGYDAWVGITPHRPNEVEEGVATALIGAGPRFWMAPLRDGSVFWYATLHRQGKLDRQSVTDRSELHDVFRGWPTPVEELLELTPDDDLVRTQVRDRAPVSEWGAGVGPVTLLGDAAHPSTPDLGQGACQAIESAAVMGECIGSWSSIAECFRAYERRRMSRTAAISRLCWMTSVNSTVEGAVMCGLRDVAIRVALEPAARSSLRWILAGHTQAP